MEPRNRFQGMNSASLCSLAGLYDSPIPPRFLAPVDSLKIPAQVDYIDRFIVLSFGGGGGDGGDFQLLINFDLRILLLFLKL